MLRSLGVRVQCDFALEFIIRFQLFLFLFVPTKQSPYLFVAIKMTIQTFPF